MWNLNEMIYHSIHIWGKLVLKQENLTESQRPFLSQLGGVLTSFSKEISIIGPLPTLEFVPGLFHC